MGRKYRVERIGLRGANLDIALVQFQGEEAVLRQAEDQQILVYQKITGQNRL